MAQKLSITLVDDVDGSDADESGTFSLDKKEYIINLSAKNADKLREALSMHIENARKVSIRSSAHSTKNDPAASDIRDGARANEFAEISDRGRISAAVRDAYLERTVTRDS
jgi:hypothetical protein